MARPQTRSDQVSGTVVRIIENKGFAFIKDERGEEYFCHRSACANFNDLSMGAAVTFTPSTGPKGLRAEAVTVL